jgi:GH25 family lysozyme M1 (1,4-beta-N-acetylmuramidase)
LENIVRIESRLGHHAEAMKRLFLLLPTVAMLCQCGGGTSGTPSSRLPQVINVSGYDPKEKQRAGSSYSEHNVSALRANGAEGLIARCGKGGVLDTKCADFLASADREGMLLGAYYRLQNHVSATAQADQFVSRMRQIARSRTWRASHFLLAADFDAKSRLADVLAFLNRVESHTGSVPVVYLENSEHLKLLLGGADAATKAKLRRSPYWIALYSHESGAGRIFPAPGSPEGLVKQYKVWNHWTLWQYGGVDWQRGRSVAKHYSHGRFRSSPYFGNLDRPIERNVFNGSSSELATFWARHGMPIR